ncbi:MAG TPA: hypothetical protein VJ963_05035, partial [Bacteroidales bacterium]|nr:hypothetical protein [Bacteroidales bacterium]
TLSFECNRRKLWRSALAGQFCRVCFKHLNHSLSQPLAARPCRHMGLMKDSFSLYGYMVR